MKTNESVSWFIKLKTNKGNKMGKIKTEWPRQANENKTTKEELYSIYYRSKFSTEITFIGTFTSEAFAVEGFRKWFRDQNYKYNDYLESIEKCYSIESVNDVFDKFDKRFKSIRMVRHLPNEVLQEIKFSTYNLGEFKELKFG